MAKRRYGIPARERIVAARCYPALEREDCDHRRRIAYLMIPLIFFINVKIASGANTLVFVEFIRVYLFSSSCKATLALTSALSPKMID